MVCLLLVALFTYPGCLWSVLCLCLFSGNLTASLTVVDLKAPFSTIDELASTDEYKVLMGYGVVQNAILQVLNSPRLSQPHVVYIIIIDVLMAIQHLFTVRNLSRSCYEDGIGKI